MKTLSINIKGLGTVPKKVSVKLLITTMSPTVLLIQETMTEGNKAKEMVKECIKDWGMTSSDADDHSGGTLIALSLALKMISFHRFETTLGIELEDSKIGRKYMILNVYGPLYERIFFGEKVKDSGALEF